MRKFAVNALLILSGLFVAALLAEAALRIVGFSSPNFYMYDAELGGSLRPGAEGLYQREGKAYVKINSDGLRDIEHKISKPDSTFRIAILGDSYAEGLQLDISKLFWKVLENQFQECKLSKERKIEVINFGASGFGTGRELLMLRKKVWKYKPDMVILAFLTGNDVRDNSKELNRVDYIPYFYLDKNNKLVLDKTYLESSSYKARKRMAARVMHLLGNKVRLLQLANSVRHAWQQRSKKNNKKVKGGEKGLDNLIYLQPKKQVWQEAWEVTEALLLQLNKEINEKHAEFLLVTLSNGIQVHPDRLVQKEFMQKQKINDLFYPDNRIKNFAQLHRIDALTLAPALAKIAKEKNLYLHGFKNTKMGKGHWNAKGHRYAGELIAQHLCKSK